MPLINFFFLTYSHHRELSHLFLNLEILKKKIRLNGSGLGQPIYKQIVFGLEFLTCLGKRFGFGDADPFM